MDSVVLICTPLGFVVAAIVGFVCFWDVKLHCMRSRGEFEVARQELIRQQAHTRLVQQASVKKAKQGDTL